MGCSAAEDEEDCRQKDGQEATFGREKILVTVVCVQVNRLQRLRLAVRKARKTL
jgi:hypothetical protein